jgi:hypothetical protein
VKKPKVRLDSGSSGVEDHQLVGQGGKRWLLLDLVPGAVTMALAVALTPHLFTMPPGLWAPPPILVIAALLALVAWVVVPPLRVLHRVYRDPPLITAGPGGLEIQVYTRCDAGLVGRYELHREEIPWSRVADVVVREEVVRTNTGSATISRLLLELTDGTRFEVPMGQFQGTSQELARRMLASRPEVEGEAAADGED